MKLSTRLELISSLLRPLISRPAPLDSRRGCEYDHRIQGVAAPATARLTCSLSAGPSRFVSWAQNEFMHTDRHGLARSSTPQTPSERQWWTNPPRLQQQTFPRVRCLDLLVTGHLGVDKPWTRYRGTTLDFFVKQGLTCLSPGNSIFAHTAR